MKNLIKCRTGITIIWVAVFVVIIFVKLISNSIRIKDATFSELFTDAQNAYRAADYYSVYEKDFGYAEKLVSEYEWSELDATEAAPYGAYAIVSPDGGKYFFEDPYVVACRLFSQNLGRSRNIGFYGNVTDKEGEVLVESGDYIIAERDNDLLNNPETKYDYLEISKVIRLDGVFSEDTIEKLYKDNGKKPIGSNYVVFGTYENACVYPSEIKLINAGETTGTYTAEKSEAGGDNVEVWINKGNTQLGSPVLQSSECEAARAVLEENTEYTDVFENGNHSQKGGNIFTAYYYGSHTLDNKYAANYSFVFHPVLMALNELKIEFIWTGALLLAAAIVSRIVIGRFVRD